MIIDNIRLPDEIESGAQYGPTWQTSLVALSSGNEQSNQDWEEKRSSGDLSYGVQNQADYSAVLAFFNARRGKSRAWLFHDWADDSLVDEQIGTGDGTNRTFLITKTYEGSGPNPYVRRITRPQTATIVVKVNDVIDTNWTSGTGGWIRFTVGHAPANGATVKMSCAFDIPVRFDNDHMDVSLEWQGAGTIPSIPFIEVRDLVNAPPTSLTLINETTSLNEDASTASHIHMADIEIDDDPFGTDIFYLSGTDASYFEIVGTTRDNQQLFLKAGTSLDFLSKSSYSCTVNVYDPSTGSNPAASAAFTLTIVEVAKPPKVTIAPSAANLANGTSTASAINLSTITIIDHSLGTGTNVVTLTGADAALFDVSGTHLRLKAGAVIVGNTRYHVTVNVGNASLPPDPNDSKNFTLTIGVVTSTTTITSTGDYTVPLYTTIQMEGWGAGAGAAGYNTVGTDGGDTIITGSISTLTAGGGKAPALNRPVFDPTGSTFFNPAGGLGGTATGGDTNTAGSPGGTGLLVRTLGAGTYTAGDGGGNPGSGGTVAYNGTIGTLPISGNGGNGASRSQAGGGSMYFAVSFDLTSGLGPTATETARPGGGEGAYFSKTFNIGDPGAPVPGDVLHCVIGAGGSGGLDFANGGNGFRGEVVFTVT